MSLLTPSTLAHEPESAPLKTDVEPGKSVPPTDTIPPLIPTEHFAERSAFRDFQLSPDGSRLAITRSLEGQAQVLILDTNTLEALHSLKLEEKTRLDWMRWAGNGRLLLSLSWFGFAYGWPVRFNRLYVRDLETSEFFDLKVNKKIIWGGDLVHLADDGSYALISVQSSLRSNPSVYRYELRPDGEIERIVKPKRGVWDWYTDDAGDVRLGMGWENKRLRVYYRANADEKFELIGKLKQDDEKSRYWNVVQIVSGSSQGYVLDEGDDGRVGVRLFDYSKGEVIDTFYENPDWDVESLWLKEDGTPLAALYTDDRVQLEWFDKESAQLHAQLKRAIKLAEVSIVSRSRDDRTMLIWGRSEADPGAFYIYSRDRKELKVLANYRPSLDFSLLVKPKPVRYTARDGLEISAYLTLPRGREPRGLPLIILPHGGPYGVRDLLEYNDEVQLLANRGYAVLQPNFRGSGGYGDEFYEAGTGEIGRRMQDDLDDAMDWAVAKGIADAKRVCLIGGSYGGYAALWGVLRNPERYACAASWAGVADFNRMLRYDRRYLSRKASRRWRAKVEGKEDFDLDSVSPAFFAPGLNRPVLLAHGTRDSVVPFSQFELFRKASEDAPVKPVTLVIEGEGHGFSSKESGQKWYDALDAFLAEHNPADQLDANGDFRPPLKLTDGLPSDPIDTH
ncbi:MAG: alpha/beta fold hydrolase [Pseudomonadota bacterium]